LSLLKAQPERLQVSGVACRYSFGEGAIIEDCIHHTCKTGLMNISRAQLAHRMDRSAK